MTLIARKFVSWDVPELASLTECKAYRMREQLNDGIKLSRDDRNWLTEAVNLNSYSKCGVPVMGWMFDFSDVLRKFWVKSYDQVAEYYAVDKTSLRKTICGSIQQIVELN
jgi:hypothetical protein